VISFLGPLKVDTRDEVDNKLFQKREAGWVKGETHKTRKRRESNHDITPALARW